MLAQCGAVDRRSASAAPIDPMLIGPSAGRRDEPYRRRIPVPPPVPRDTVKFIAPTIYIIDVRQKSESAHPFDAEFERNYAPSLPVDARFS